tara:strand:- start:2695 stop:3150 length:456 start_codon:yes stop_codon:yes gene_type:complete
MYSEKVTSSSESDQEDFRKLAEFEAQVWELMDETGYERDACVTALEDANYDETDAINWLLYKNQKRQDQINKNYETQIGLITNKFWNMAEETRMVQNIEHVDTVLLAASKCEDDIINIADKTINGLNEIIEDLLNENKKLKENQRRFFPVR